MKWTNEKRKLGDLIGYDKNPRKLSDKQKLDLKKSIDKFDLVEVPAINLDNMIIAGHQRIKLLLEKYGSDYVIDVRIPDRLLNEKEYKEYLLRSNKNTGDWDWDILHFEENDFLIEVGFNDWELNYAEIDPKEFYENSENKAVELNCDTCGKISEYCKSCAQKNGKSGREWK